MIIIEYQLSLQKHKARAATERERAKETERETGRERLVARARISSYKVVDGVFGGGDEEDG